MTSRFFLPARVAVSALGLLLVASPNATSYGQTPTPTATPSPTPHKAIGRLRFWNMVPTQGTSLELVSASDPSKAIATASGMNLLANYDDLPPGHYTLQVFRAGDRQTPLKNLDVVLKDGTYVTVLAHEPVATTATLTPATSPAGSPVASTATIVVELIDDTPDPAKPDNQLTVRQYCPGARVIVSTASRQSTDTLSYGSSQTLTGLSGNIVPLVARAATKIGPRTFNTEADFSVSSRSTLLLMDDAYGRFRPRLTSDGPPKPTPTPKP